MTRILISTRVFGLAAVLGLAASAGVIPDVGGPFVLLCALSALASVPQATRTGLVAMAIVEGGLVALTVSVGGVVSQPLGLYLAVPVLIAGLLGGVGATAVTLATELAMIVAVQAVSQQLDLVPGAMRDVLPWVLTGLAIGLLGAWVRHLKTVPTDTEQTEYAAAHRLLDELRLVSRRLSSGLDSVRLGSALLEACQVHVGGAGALLVRDDAGEFVPLVAGGLDVDVDGWDREMLESCWQGAQSVHRSPATGDVIGEAPSYGPGQALRRLRLACPVRVGSRMVALLAVEGPRSAKGEAMAEVQALLDEGALPLSAALVFDEVRAMATVEERQRLAREIHDGVAQEVASLGYLVDALEPAPNGGSAQALTMLRGELGRITEDLRLSIFDLRSQVSHTAGLGSVLADYLQEAGARSGVAVHLTLEESPVRLGLAHEEQLLRIVQEAVTNARKHSGARNLWVSCRIRPPAAEILVEDDGAGLGRRQRAEGFGLTIMRERAQRIGAVLSVEDRNGGGTRVAVRLQPRHEPSSSTPEFCDRDGGLRVHADDSPKGALAHA